MSKRILGVIAGLAAWAVVVNAAGLVMRLSWPAYTAVAATLAFTLPMLIARLSIGAVATFVVGLVTARIAPRPLFVRLAPGVLMLLFFIPVHVRLWHAFPPWYHLTFLLSLVPLTYAGGSVAAGSGTSHEPVPR